MIRTVYGDVLSFRHGILAHGVNAQGKFNAGVAKKIREAYPQAYHDYMDRYEKVGLDVGDVIYTHVSPALVIASCVTQYYYGRDTDTLYVDYPATAHALAHVAAYAVGQDIPVGLPMIGVGLGNADWRIMERIFESVFWGVDNVTIYLHNGL